MESRKKVGIRPLSGEVMRDQAVDQSFNDS